MNSDRILPAKGTAYGGLYPCSQSTNRPDVAEFMAGTRSERIHSAEGCERPVVLLRGVHNLLPQLMPRMAYAISDHFGDLVQHMLRRCDFAVHLALAAICQRHGQFRRVAHVLRQRWIHHLAGW